jgi:hypothetical protein
MRTLKFGSDPAFGLGMENSTFDANQIAIEACRGQGSSAARRRRGHDNQIVFHIATI